MKKVIQALTKKPANPAIQKVTAATIQKISQQINLKNYNFSDQTKVLPKTINPDVAKAAQRLARLVSPNKNTPLTADNIQTIANLHNAGLHSAYQIASMPQQKFIKNYVGCFGGTPDVQKTQAKNLHQTALAVKTNSVLNYAAIAQHKNAFYGSMRADNLSAATDANFDSLPSYKDLFGDLSFCECPDCRSIYSPAAYFVDLMRLVDNYITVDPTKTAYQLATRRPDLSNILLNCANTNNMVSKLEIVNSVLLTNANTTFETLSEATTVYPFNLPFNLNLVRTNSYLAQNNLSLAEIVKKLNFNFSDAHETTLQQNLALQQLGISTNQWSIYTSNTAANIDEYYGASSTDNLALISTFLAKTGLSNDELNELLCEDLSKAEMPSPITSSDPRMKFFINSSSDQGTNTPIAINLATGSLINCTTTNSSFDCMHRFIRLAKALGWSFTDLDWALRTASNVAGSSTVTISNAILPYLAWIKDLKDNNNLSINQICGFLYQVKDFGDKSGTTFFDRVFNSPLIPNLPAWNSYTKTWNIPQPGVSEPAATADQQIQNALMIALNLSRHDLVAIAQTIAGTASSITLTQQNFAIFYRISLLSKIVGLSLDECEVLYSLTNSEAVLLTDLVLASGAQAYTIACGLIDSAKWLKDNKLSVYRLQYWLTQESDDPEIANKIMSDLDLTVFLTELQTLMSSASTESADEQQKAFIDHFATQLSGLYKVDFITTCNLITWIGITFDDIISTVPATVASNIAKLQLGQVYADWIKTLKLSYSDVASITTYPTYFPLNWSTAKAGTNWLTFENVKTLYRLSELHTAFADKYGSFLGYLYIANNNSNNAQASATALAAVTGWDETQLYGLMTNSDNVVQWQTFDDVYLLYRYFSLAQKANVGVNVINDIMLQFIGGTTFDDYGQLQVIADQLWSGLLIQYQDNNQALTKINNSLLNQQRDALLPLVIYNLSTRTTNPVVINNDRDLYEYLLIDVKTDAIVETSYIVEANTSLQLYIYRCLNYLETAVTTIDEDLSTQWEWMQNYRIWQANREVFLYPENYITPELRKNKTSLFSKLQDDLQQGDLGNQSVVIDALGNYIDNFLKITNLRIVGSGVYDYSEDGTDANNVKNICLVGTNLDRSNYYYLTGILAKDSNGNYNAVEWSEWLSIDCHLQPLSDVTPVFALGKWFIFWMEKKQDGAEGTAPDTQPLYRYESYYSSLNNMKRWSNKQTVASNIFTEALAHQTVTYPIYVKSCKTLLVSCEGIITPDDDINNPAYTPTSQSQIVTVSLGQNDLSQMLIGCICYAASMNPVLPDELTNTYKYTTSGASIQYYQSFSSTTLPTITVQTTANRVTVSCWVYLNSLPNASSKLNLFSYQVTTVNPFISIDSSGNIYIGSSLTTAIITAGKWYHVTIAYDGKGFYTLYLNGQSFTSPNRLFRISGSVILGQASFPGMMQEVLLFNDTLSSNQILELYNNSKDHITRDFGVFTNPRTAFTNLPVTETATATYINPPVMGQPNWNIIQFNNTISLVASANATSGLLNATRLNSTAAEKLNSSFAINGVDGLLSINSQLMKEASLNALSPVPASINQMPSATLDFTSGPMSNYYWELFFYVPFLIASQLKDQQHFKTAKEWFEYIFNPSINQVNWDLQTNEYANDKYWRFIGLRSLYNPILNTELTESLSAEMQSDLTNSAQLYEYHNDPFDPHVIARLRPIAYQKAIVINYVGNLISWGDNLYRQFTRENISEAEMLYTMAYDLLGNKPISLGECPLPPAENWNTMITNAGGGTAANVPEFLIEIENSAYTPPSYPSGDSPSNYIPSSYFGLPQNTQFTSYWDQINQRLYNIRHSLTIDGIFEQIPLFAPEINPMQLVQEVGSGMNMQDVISSLSAQIPYYRFKVLIQKAKEMANVTIQFGQSLLSALEKRDAEQLSRMYSINQQNILAMTMTSKQNELNAAQQTVQSLQASLQNAQDRLTYYSNMISGGWSAAEKSQIMLEGIAADAQVAAQIPKGMAIGAYLAPTIFGFADGGFDPGDSVAMIPSIFEGSAQAVSMSGSLAGTIASYQRRDQEWELQKTLANDDVTQIQYQLLAAQYQQAIAEQEIAILQKNIEQEQKIYQFMINKFSSQEMYQWLVGQLSGTYFQSYHMSFELAKQCEQAWCFEKGLPTSDPSQSIIKASYWNSLYHGLSAGEALLLDMNRLEKSYIEQDARSLEITKTISLVWLSANDANNTGQFGDLQNTGTCIITLSNDLFNNDYSNHYCRQIKTVSLSFPALIGPYQNICATLTQTANTVYLKDGTQKTNLMPNQQVALSQGVNDSGLFSLNFGDDRYLPFEGTGAVSTWTLTINNATALDIKNNLNDVIINLSYTALAGSGS